MPIWYATLATRLCHDLANQPGVPDPYLANLALAAANAALSGRQTFELPPGQASEAPGDWGAARTPNSCVGCAQHLAVLCL